VYLCKYCDYASSSNLSLEIHLQQCHRCLNCNYMDVTDLVTQHRENCNQIGGRLFSVSGMSPFKEIRAFKGFLRTFRQVCRTPFKSIETYFSYMKDYIGRVVDDALKEMKSVKIQLCVDIVFRRYLADGVYEETKKPINSFTHILCNILQFESFYGEAYAKIDNTVSIFQNYGSGWVFHQVTGLDVKLGIYRSLRGSCWFPTPKFLRNKNFLVNIKNNDKKCFMWAVLSVLYKVPQKNVSRPSTYYEFIQNHDFDCLEFPVSDKMFPKFEEVNQIALNIFSYDVREHILPYYISKHNYTDFKTVNLILVKHPDYPECSHYIGVRDINALMGKKQCHRRILCYYCLRTYKKSTNMTLHVKHCSKQEIIQKVKLPRIENGQIPKLKFKNFKNQIKAEYVGYADFETILVKYKGSSYKDSRIVYQVKKKRQHFVSKHVPSGFSYVVVNAKGRVINKRVYRGKDCVSVFLEDMLQISEIVHTYYTQKNPLYMSEIDELDFQNSTICHICKQLFLEDDIKCRDHCHQSGKYRGASHQNCNLKFQREEFFPVLLHNFTSFDSHLIVRGLNNIGNDIRVIPSNSEKFMSVQVNNIRFLDSLQFLPQGLGTLVDTLTKGNLSSSFSILEQCFPKELCPLVKAKGIYPYEYMDSFKKFKEKELPARSKFFSSLRNSSISEKEYKHAQNVFKQFKMTSLGDYHDTYLLSDSALLACVFENFRKLSIKHYKLDPMFYYSTPGLSFDAALKMTGVELEHIVDLDMYMFLEGGMRGGLSMIPTRYFKANNKYMDSYNSDVKSTFILNMDMNNLYGYCLQDYLPISNFEWASDKFIKNFNVQNIDDNSEEGYIIECDLDYPSHLHKAHNDYPLAPEKINVPKKWLGRYQRKLLKKLNIKYNENQTKLIPHFRPRKHYTLHYRNLKFYLEQGMILREVHRILKFKQSKWLSVFIQFNTDMRAKAKSKAEEELFKLMNNSVYGKTVQNQRKQRVIHIVNNQKRAKSLVSRPEYKTFQYLDKNLCTIELFKRVVKLDRPIYVGVTCLELSKLAMYKFHYEKIKSWYGSKTKLLVTDTDSLCYGIETKDVYKDMKRRSQFFDTSNYDKSHPLYSETNKKVVGKMKDEAEGFLYVTFIGLSSKVYSLNGEDKSLQKAKSTPTRVTQQILTHKVYESVFKEQRQLYCRATQLKSQAHTIDTVACIKSALHGFDTKRYICKNGIDTLSWGHIEIE